MRHKTKQDTLPLNLVRTNQEKMEFLSAIDELIGSLYSLKGNMGRKIDSVFPYKKKEKILSLLQENQVSLSDRSGVLKFFTGLSQIVKCLPVVNVQLAFEPNEEIIERIYSWFYLNLGREVVLDVVVNKDIMGGVVVVAGGKYLDFSLRKKIEKEVLPKWLNSHN